MSKEFETPKYENVRQDVSFKDIYKSPWLGAMDFDDDKDTVVVLEKAFSAIGTFDKGRKEECIFGRFKGYDKDIVINTTNAKQIAKFAGSQNLSDWKNIPIQVYVDHNVKGMGGVITSGWRIRTKQPKITLPALTPESPQWKAVVTRLKEGGSIDAAKQHFNLTPENEQLLLEEVANA